jgi:Domain of unknown function (DUF4440)
MTLTRISSLLALLSLTIVPTLVLTQVPASAAGRKAEWKAPKAKKATVSAPTAPADTPASTLPGSLLEAPPISAAPETAVPVQDQSQDVLDNDLAMAAVIAANGPKVGYSSALSEVGVLFDANGSSPAGIAAATSRFDSFPADVSFVRSPEKAIAAGGSGSSWGSYTIKRGDTVLSSGRYISVWRREPSGWKMISELAAGKTIAPPPSAVTGSLPKRPAQLGRATPAPIGVPLTIPTPAAAATIPEPPPAPPTP